MSFLDLLEKAGKEPAAMRIKFLLEYKHKGKTLHFFFEGADDQSFYTNFIDNILPDNYNKYYYNCGGKDKVLINYQDINWASYSKHRVLFFIDKDLDDLLNIPQPADINIFITKYYSIENYIVNQYMYERFLREICNVIDESIIQEMKDKFELQLAIYYNLIRRLSAWIAFCRKNKYELNLNDLDISKIYTIDNSFNIKRIIPKTYKSIFDFICLSIGNKYYSLSEIKKYLIDLDLLSEEKLCIRGKYELHYMFTFCKKTIDLKVPEWNKKITQYNKNHKNKIPKCKVTVQITPENIFTILSPRIRIPEDLRIFLDNHAVNLPA